MVPFGKLLFFIGLVCVAAGLALWGGARVPLLSRLGHLPGDIYLRCDNFAFYLPLTTSIAISLLLSLLFMLLRR